MTNQTTQPTGMLTPEQLQKIIDVCASKDAPVMGLAIRINSIVSQAYEARIKELEAQVAGYKLHMQRQGKSIAAHVFAALQSHTNSPDHIHLHAGEEKPCAECDESVGYVCQYHSDVMAASEESLNNLAAINQRRISAKNQEIDELKAHITKLQSIQPQAAPQEFIAQHVLDHCWKMYQQGQISADHTAKEVFEQTLQSFAYWVRNQFPAPQEAQNNEEALLKVLMNLYQEVIATNETYERLGGNGDPLFEEELIAIEKAISQPANEVTEYWCGTCERNVDRGCGDSACQVRYKLPAKPANEVKVDECLTCASGITKPEPSDPYDDRSGHYHSQVPSDKQAVQAVPSVSDMVNRFLCWPLPKDFYPDCGISFDGRKDDEWNKNKTWPIGTNLLTAEQAKAMFEHCLSAAPQPDQKG